MVVFGFGFWFEGERGRGGENGRGAVRVLFVYGALLPVGGLKKRGRAIGGRREEGGERKKWWGVGKSWQESSLHSAPLLCSLRETG